MCSFKADNISSEELQRLAGLKTEEAKSLLVVRYLPLVKSRVMFFFGQASEFDDLVQEAYIGLLSALDSFDPNAGTSFGYFARLCIDRALINYGKSKKHKEPAGYIPLDESLGTAGIGPEASAIIRDEYVSVLNKAKSELSDFEYSVFCFYVSGYGNSEIADLMKVEPKSVDNAVHRFRCKLKSLNGVEI